LRQAQEDLALGKHARLREISNKGTEVGWESMTPYRHRRITIVIFEFFVLEDNIALVLLAGTHVFLDNPSLGHGKHIRIESLPSKCERMQWKDKPTSESRILTFWPSESALRTVLRRAVTQPNASPSWKRKKPLDRIEIKEWSHAKAYSGALEDVDFASHRANVKLEATL